MSGCKHKGARKVQKSYQCIHSTERESTPSQFLLHIVNVSVIYLCYLKHVHVLCFEHLFCVMRVRLSCCFDNVDAKWTENAMTSHWVGASCCSHLFLVCFDRHEIHTLTSCCTCTDSRLYLQVFVHSGCQVAHAVLYDYCNNFSWKEKCSFFVFMFCKKMITELFFVLI